jgi:hypothetical protein
MADTVQIGNTGHTAKIRHPVAVAIFSLITLGIYYVYWWYQVNREVVDSQPPQGGVREYPGRVDRALPGQWPAGVHR